MAEKPNDHSDDEDSFQDASETVPVAETMDFETAIQECHVALNLFLNNRFDDAKKLLEPWADSSIYHALGYGTILYLQATMTFEMADIETAVKVVKRTIQVCNKARKKSSVLSSLSKTNYDKYTTVELHAELCYAEAQLERALLTFIQDENLINFVKGSLKIRAGHQSYKECLKVLEKRNWNQDDAKPHFESGVCMGNGMFNLMISLLPSKILKLLEFVGFSGNKTRGLSDLGKGASLDKSLRGPLCVLALLAYHTIVTYVLGTADGDIEKSEEMVTFWLQRYPKGAMFLFFAGRVEEIKGNIEEAIQRFEESIDSQAEWKQFHHLCYWELMWCHSFIGDWLMAMKYAERLCKESRWSKATYMYLKASFLLMCGDQSEETGRHIDYLFGEVPKLLQRMAGKSIPIEKFAVKKAKKYFEQKKRLTLPAFEMIYVWNLFSIIGKKPQLLEPFLSKTEETINYLVQNEGDIKNFADDYCLALLLKAVCLRYSGSYLQAEQCYTEILTLEKKIKIDTYLIPYALVELGLLFLELNKAADAAPLLDRAKEKYKGYSMESRLHFRIHAANMRIKNASRRENSSVDNSSEFGSVPPSPSHVTDSSASGDAEADHVTSSSANGKAAPDHVIASSASGDAAGDHVTCDQANGVAFSGSNEKHSIDTHL